MITMCRVIHVTYFLQRFLRVTILTNGDSGDIVVTNDESYKPKASKIP
jgi:hypothetical protein